MAQSRVGANSRAQHLDDVGDLEEELLDHHRVALPGQADLLAQLATGDATLPAGANDE